MVQDEAILTMNQVSKRLGIPSRKLRRYCDSSLLPQWKYVIGKRRTFTEEQVDWLKRLYYLEYAGFTMKDLRRYVQLEHRGDTEAQKEQTALLRTHRRQIWQELEDLQTTIDFLERQEEIILAKMQQGGDYTKD